MNNVENKDIKKLKKPDENKKCTHPVFFKEYHLGGQTVDYICTTCGMVASEELKSEIEKNK